MTEHEWRESVDARPSALLIGVVVIVAAALRLWHLGYGVPFSVGVDEPVIVDTVVRIMNTGDYNPHFFDYPSLYIYVQVVVACGRFMAGAMQGTWHSLAQVHAADFYLWGRAVTAILGAATVLVVYQIGLRWGARHALLAAALMAFVPLHVRESHFVLTDVPMTFLTTVAFLSALRLQERGTIAAAVWAGAAAGLADALKANEGLVLVLPVMAVFASPSLAALRARTTAIVIVACVAAFLLTAPYTVLDLPGFLNGYGDLAAHYRGRGVGEEAGWLIYLKYLRLAIGWPAFILMFGGLLLSVVHAWRGPAQARSAMLVVFPILYFLLVATRTQIFARYLLPLLPQAALMVGIATMAGVDLMRRFDIPRPVRSASIAALAVAALLPAAVAAIGFDRGLGRTTTTELAYRWILASVPEGTHIAVEGYSLHLPQSRYKVDNLRRLIERDRDAYRAAGVRYFVANEEGFANALDADAGARGAGRAYRALLDGAAEVAAFPQRRENPGPEYRIYEVR